MAASDQSETLTETQMEILDVIWNLGGASVGEVWTQITANRKVARNTILTHMDRLEKKGWLKRQGDGPIQKFAVTRSRKQTLRRLTRQFVDSVFGGSPESLLLALFEGQKLTSDEAERIHKLIEEARRRHQ
jgi:predicted transcriptional regulator